MFYRVLPKARGPAIVLQGQLSMSVSLPNSQPDLAVCLTRVNSNTTLSISDKPGGKHYRTMPLKLVCSTDLFLKEDWGVQPRIFYEAMDASRDQYSTTLAILIEDERSASVEKVGVMLAQYGREGSSISASAFPHGPRRIRSTVQQRQLY